MPCQGHPRLSASCCGRNRERTSASAYAVRVDSSCSAAVLSLLLSQRLRTHSRLSSRTSSHPTLYLSRLHWRKKSLYCCKRCRNTSSETCGHRVKGIVRGFQGAADGRTGGRTVRPIALTARGTVTSSGGAVRHQRTEACEPRKQIKNKKNKKQKTKKKRTEACEPRPMCYSVSYISSRASYAHLRLVGAGAVRAAKRQPRRHGHRVPQHTLET